MEAFERILSWTRTLQRALARRAIGEVLWASVLWIAGGFVLGIALAGWLGPGPGRWAWLCPGAALVAAGRSWWHGWVLDEERQSMVAVARFAQRRVGGTDSGIVTALESYALLRGEGPKHWPRPSATLARLSAERTLERIEGTGPRSLVDHHRHHTLRGAALAALVLGTVLLALSPSWLESGLHALTSDTDEAGEASPIELALRDVTLRLHYPHYLDRASRTFEGTRGDVSTLAGTTIEVSGEPTLLGARAELILEGATRTIVPMTTRDEGRVGASFLARESGRYRFALVGSDGQRFEEKRGRVLDVRPDGIPMIRILRPEADLEVREGDPISLAFEASDDHGLDQIALWIDGPIGGPERRVLRRGVGDPVLKGVDEVGLGDLGLSPGESAEIWLEAVDENDITGPGVGRSATRRIWMFSPEVEHARRLTDLEALIDAMIGTLADRLESPVHGEDPSRVHATVLWHQAIVGSSASLVGAMEALIGALNTDTLASEALRELLTETRASVQSIREQEDALLRRAVLSGGPEKRPTVLMRMIAQTNEEGIGDLERRIFALKDELDRSRQDRVLDEGRELLEQQESLREILARLAAGDESPELQAEAQRQLDRLEASLSRMANELDRLAERSPYENQNPSQRDSETEEDVHSMEREMEAIRELLREGRIEEAMKRLEALNKATQEWMAALSGDFGERETTPSPHRRALTEFQMKLSEITDGQRGVEGETGAETTALDEERLRALDEQLAKAYGEASSLARELAGRLGALDENPLHESDRLSLAEAQSQGSTIVASLERRAIQEALDTLVPLRGRLASLVSEIHEVEARELDPARVVALGAILEGLDPSVEISGELEVLLKRLLDDLQRPPGGAAKRRLGAIGKRQRALRRAVGRLEGKLGGIEEAIPGIGDDLGPSLEDARKEMKAARGALERGEPGQAQGHQRAALDKLSDAQSRFERLARNSPGGQGGGQGMRGARDEVAIPDSDPYAAPEAFRRELIEAMKERAPAGYEDAVRRYYEELVR